MRARQRVYFVSARVSAWEKVCACVWLCVWEKVCVCVCVIVKETLSGAHLAVRVFECQFHGDCLLLDMINVLAVTNDCVWWLCCFVTVLDVRVVLDILISNMRLMPYIFKFSDFNLAFCCSIVKPLRDEFHRNESSQTLFMRFLYLLAERLKYVFLWFRSRKLEKKTIILLISKKISALPREMENSQTEIFSKQHEECPSPSGTLHSTPFSPKSKKVHCSPSGPPIGR